MKHINTFVTERINTANILQDKTYSFSRSEMEAVYFASIEYLKKHKKDDFAVEIRDLFNNTYGYRHKSFDIDDMERDKIIEVINYTKDYLLNSHDNLDRIIFQNKNDLWKSVLEKINK